MRGSIPTDRRDSAALHPLGMPTPVTVRTDSSGRPRTLRPDRQVVQIREVWRIDDEWWRRPISRLYHQVVLDDGRVVVLYRDLVDGRWYRQ